MSVQAYVRLKGLSAMNANPPKKLPATATSESQEIEHEIRLRASEPTNSTRHAAGRTATNWKIGSAPKKSSQGRNSGPPTRDSQIDEHVSALFTSWHVQGAADYKRKRPGLWLSRGTPVRTASEGYRPVVLPQLELERAFFR